jgi:hypothetical protein
MIAAYTSTYECLHLPSPHSILTYYIGDGTCPKLPDHHAPHVHVLDHVHARGHHVRVHVHDDVHDFSLTLSFSHSVLHPPSAPSPYCASLLIEVLWLELLVLESLTIPTCRHLIMVSLIQLGDSYLVPTMVVELRLED